jgi:hypothetical protein
MTLATDMLRVTAVYDAGTTDTGEPMTENEVIYIAKSRIIQIRENDDGSSNLTVDGGGKPYIVNATETPAVLLIQSTAI